MSARKRSRSNRTSGRVTPKGTRPPETAARGDHEDDGEVKDTPAPRRPQERPRPPGRSGVVRGNNRSGSRGNR